MDNPGYYANIPANVRYDKELSANAKLLYGELTALSNKEGYCWAGNQYFASLYGVTKVTVSTWIGQLKEGGYIDVQMQYKEGSKQILNRYIRISGEGIKENLNTSQRKPYYPIKENLKDNNTINNTSNITVNKGETSSPDTQGKFVPPTIDEVVDYCNQKMNGVDPYKFWHFYDSKGWMVGKNKMKKWQSAIATWTKQERPNDKHKRPSEAGSKWLDLNAEF